jgi:hypothetical protein
MKGYQAENEAASRRIKELEVQLKEAAALHIPAAFQRDDGLKASKQEAAHRLSELLSLQAQLEVRRCRWLVG